VCISLTDVETGDLTRSVKYYLFVNNLLKCVPNFDQKAHVTALIIINYQLIIIKMD
jgi:hypothetical protein